MIEKKRERRVRSGYLPFIGIVGAAFIAGFMVGIADMLFPALGGPR